MPRPGPAPPRPRQGSGGAGERYRGRVVPESERGQRGEPVTRTCDLCGRREVEGAATLTWSTAVEAGRRKTFCEECSRTHVRAMEGKLDSDFW